MKYTAKKYTTGQELLRLETNAGSLVWSVETSKPQWAVVDESGNVRMVEKNGKIELSVFNQKRTAEMEAEFLSQ